ncbi:MAG: hypothetical protein J6D08_07910 [Lachnospiraceae bacterium]|nr:hypothetical protein [Lachnospiraceae bacterium]
MKKTGSLLDILIRIRTYEALDKAVEKDRNCRHALKRQDKAFNALSEIPLDKEQRIIVDRAITATNECGTAYGEAAYRLGLHDGIRLGAEIEKIK